ncbi:MAG: hypothetical protein VX966_08880 [Chloroflexota bacterium]|nr:hypothetical protein [Chloroflexota bacterium]
MSYLVSYFQVSENNYGTWFGLVVHGIVDKQILLVSFEALRSPYSVLGACFSIGGR